MMGIRKTLLIFVLNVTVILHGSGAVFADEAQVKQSSLEQATLFLQKAKPLFSHDIIYDLKPAEAAITEAITQENLDRIFLVLEYYYSLEHIDKIREYSDKLEDMARQLNRSDFVRLADVYRAYAVAVEGDYNTAISDLEDQLKVAIKMQDNLTAVSIYDALATLVPFQGEFYVALEYADQAMRLLKKTPYEHRLRLHLYNSLAYIYTELEDLDQALEFSNSCLDLAMETGLYLDISTVVYNVGLVLQNQRHFDLSSLYFTELIEFYQQAGHPEMVIYPYYGLAMNAYKQGKTTESLGYVEQALEYSETSEDFTVSLWQLSAEQYAMLGQVEKAQKFREDIEAFFIAKPSYQGSRWANLNQRIDAQIAFAAGRYKEAYRILDKFHLEDVKETEKAFSNDVLKLRAGLEATMRIEKAEKDILLERNAYKLQQMMFLIGAFLVILVIVLGAFIVQRRTVIALNKSKRDAEKANKAKTEFLANMSHELRTPLNAIIGFSEMMTEKIYGPLGHKNYIQYAEMINGSGQHLLGIISEILDMSKVESGSLEIHELECDLIEFVQAALRMFADQKDERNITLNFEAPDDLPYLKADLRILNQILYNGLSNALKFNRQDGWVNVTLSQLPESGALRVVIEDGGIGMSEEELSHVLKPFAQVQNSLTRAHEGTGLGLPLMESFMKLHGGTLQVISEKGQGTTLILTFPPERTLVL